MIEPTLPNETPAERFSRIITAARAKKELEERNKNNATIQSNPTNNSSGNINLESNKQSEDARVQIARSLLAKLPAFSTTINRSTVPAVTDTNSSTNPTIILEQAAVSERASSSTESENTLENNLSTEFIGVSRSGESISYNEKQLSFIKTAGEGDSCILIGAAGTGKTTCMRGVIQNLIQSGIAGILHSDGHSYLPASGVPGIVVCAYTRRATANIRKQMPDDLKSNCITIHKLLEYQPVYDSVTDPETGIESNKMTFQPTRNMLKPLPPSIHTIIIEESSMVAVSLYQEIINACPHKPQIIFLGDIQQLPSVFGPAILGYKMLELKTVELTEVYRQALESPIIRLAHRILSGRPIPVTEYESFGALSEEEIQKGKKKQLTLHPWKKKLAAELGLLTAAKFFTTAVDSGAYDSEQDQILLPFNKSFGTLELNKHIAQHLARKREAIIYEVVAGFNKHYFSIGDKVLVDRDDAVILDISPNPEYSGKQAQKHSQHLDYWGYNPRAAEEARLADSSASVDDAEFFLDSYQHSEDDDRVRKCSHIITVELTDTGINRKISQASDVNNMLLAYALTVHKAQGSEWRKVFLVLHQSHNTMLQRELLYTAVTRAKEELYVICEPESFTAGIEKQKIKGNTLAEKAEFFKGKLDINGGY